MAQNRETRETQNPALLAGQDPQKLSRANKARSHAYRPALELITGFAINWCVIAAATPSWARSVFPGVPEAEAVDRSPAAVERGGEGVFEDTTTIHDVSDTQEIVSSSPETYSFTNDWLPTDAALKEAK